jgi:triosephosphate isomerase (TIM)
MKHIFLNLKRFDIPRKYGGVNNIAPIKDWGAHIIKSTQNILKHYKHEDVAFTMFFPEAHLVGAVKAQSKDSLINIGCQGVYREDTAHGGNFGAFTGNRPAHAVKAIGCTSVIIGHCEERRDKMGIMQEAGVSDAGAVNRLLNQEIQRAKQAGLSILYCIGETADEQQDWQPVLEKQLAQGLHGIDSDRIVIAYEPVWAIGPGKSPPGRAYIEKIARFVKEKTGGLPVVYGGGLKQDNARMLASIAEIDGGLIALTRFSGEIGFYPDEYIDIIEMYLSE